MNRRAILGTVAILFFAEEIAAAGAVRAVAAPAGATGSARTNAVSPSQRAAVSRPDSNAAANRHASTSRPQDSGFFFAPSDGHVINHDRRVPSNAASRYWKLTPAMPAHGPHGFDPCSRSHAYFPRPVEVVIIEVPPYLERGSFPQVVPTTGWLEPGLYDDPPADSRTRAPGQLAPFDPAPQEVVDRMLALAGVKKSDVVYDLGAGDGRVVIAAAKKYGVRAVGFEVDPGLVKLARENVRKRGLEKLVEIRQQDFLTADLSAATVVTLYLSYDGNLALWPQLMRQLKPGARIVSYGFDMGDWQPKIVETYRDAAGESHALYLWEIGAPMAFSDRRR